jgi:hypothetical protein
MIHTLDPSSFSSFLELLPGQGFCIITFLLVCLIVPAVAAPVPHEIKLTQLVAVYLAPSPQL